MRFCMVLLFLSTFHTSWALVDAIDELPQPRRLFVESFEDMLDDEIMDGSFAVLPVAAYDHYEGVKGLLPSRYHKTYEDFVNLQILSASFIVILWALPEDISRWDHDKIQSRNIFNNWYDNIKAGPVQDTDKFWINYGGHSLSGAYFYTLARNNGMTAWEATTFNFLMSTFYWEYGVEAFFEIPSAQDLWITPILGSLLGERFYQWEQEIRANEGKIWGSERFGSFILVLLNPEGALANWLRIHENRVDISLVSRFSTYSKDQTLRYMMGANEPWLESYIGFEITVKF